MSDLDYSGLNRQMSARANSDQPVREPDIDRLSGRIMQLVGELGSIGAGLDTVADRTFGERPPSGASTADLAKLVRSGSIGRLEEAVDCLGRAIGNTGNIAARFSDL